MSPPWFKLIKHHQRKGNLALTIPFLIGALRDPSGSRITEEAEARHALHVLLARLESEVPESHFVSVSKCPTLGEPVVSIVPSYYSKNYAMWGIRAPTKRPTLRVSAPYSTSDASSSADIFETLWAILRDPLTSGRFSYRDGAYAEFNTSDEIFVRDALAYDEENEL